MSLINSTNIILIKNIKIKIIIEIISNINININIIYSFYFLIKYIFHF